MITKDDEITIKKTADKLRSKNMVRPIFSFLEEGFFPFSAVQTLFDISEPLLSIFFQGIYINDLEKIFATKENFSFFIKEMEK